MRMRDVRRFQYARRLNGYGDVGSDIVNFVAKASPWEAIISAFRQGEVVAQAKATVAQADAQVAMVQAQSKSQTVKYLAMGAVVFVGGLAVIAMVKR